MILPVHARVRSALQHALSTAFGLVESELPAIVIETPSRRAFGDLAVPVAFELARRLKKAPRAIAHELKAALPPIDGVGRVDAAPNGYLNFYLDRAAFLRGELAKAPDTGDTEITGRTEGSGGLPQAADTAGTEITGHTEATGNPGGEPAAADTGQPKDRLSVSSVSSVLKAKVIVEHTAINPNKAAHIGHLRNAALGDTLVRVLRFQGFPVEVQNYIDDTGVQVADVVVGFTALERRDFAAVRALVADPAVRFDHYCWDLYARVTEWYEGDPSRLETRAHALHAIEAGGNELAEMGALIADRIVRCHLDTMARMNVGYDLLTWEGDILRLHFWATAFEQLKARGAVFLQTEGRLKGCWVMRIEDEAPAGSDATATDAEENASDTDAEQREKVIVRSNGTVTYVGKDIANQFWKFGLLGRDFFYRVFDRRNGRLLWATTSHDGASASAPQFGRAAAVFNVIDSRQAYLQQLLKQALASMGFTTQAASSTHFSYEMVALSHSTARALGYDDAESAGKPFVEVSGRKGLGVKADDLLDRLIERATGEVATRNPDLGEADSRRIAETIATAAVRYFLVKFSRGKVIAFDIDEALSFEGETGPYLQYAVVRANNIFAKLAERDGLDEAAVVARLAGTGREPIESGEQADELWSMVLDAARLDEIVETSVRSLELSVLAKYAFGLSQTFNAFYHRQQILREEREDARLWRAAGVAYFRRQLTRALDLMGCGVPSRM